MAGPNESQPEPRASDPDALTKGLEMELMLKRASWEKAHAKRNTWRALSFAFLFLVILAAFIAYFYLMPQLSRRTPDMAREETRAAVVRLDFEFMPQETPIFF